MYEKQTVPGIEIVKRKLHVYFLCDKSTSMEGSKIAALNEGICASVHAIGEALRQHPEVDVIIHALTIGTEAQWHIPEEGVPIADFKWQEIKAGGKTRTGLGINMLCDKFEKDRNNSRGFPPLCLLISDGFYSDSKEYYEGSIARLNKTPWGIKAVRLVIAIGSEEFYDLEALQMFNNQSGTGVIQVQNYREITKYIVWASVTATVNATRSKSLVGDSGAVVTGDIMPAIPRGQDIW